MRRTIAIILCFFLVVGMCACGSPYQYTEDDVELAWQDGFDQGYDGACEDIDLFFSEGYDDGYTRGYDDGLSRGKLEYKKIVNNIVSDAEHHAVIIGGMHPEEAWDIIDSYVNKKQMIGGGYPSYDDYIGAIDSMIAFYEYFYSKNYYDYLLE